MMDNNFVADIEVLFTQAQNTLLSKHRDYGPKNISEAPGGALNGLLVRMHDKMARAKHLTYNNAIPNHESLEDTFMDLANYSIIAIMVLQGKWPE
jgi:hypothetical protein